MKFTKPITTRSGIVLPAALISLGRIDIRMEAETALVQIRVHKDVGSEELGEVLDPPFSKRYVIRNEEGGPATFTNQVIPAMKGQNLMQRIRAFIKNQIGPEGCVDVDTDTN